MVTIDCSEQPLQVSVVDRRLVITIGVNTLAFADKERQELESGFSVTNADGFAEDVKRELERDNEIGATLLTDLLDAAMRQAKEDGSVHVNHL